MKTYKLPDLSAPRYRPKKLNFTNKEFIEQFKAQHPRYANLSTKDFKKIIHTYNGLIWETVINYRDGIELPEQLGYIFLGTCPKRVKKISVDYKRSSEYGVTLQNQNWESDQYVAKIFYTNYETKYNFRNSELWMFNGVRDFKRSVAKTYPKQWKMYVVVDNKKKISRIFRIERFKHSKNEETSILLESYDEFNLD